MQDKLAKELEQLKTEELVIQKKLDKIKNKIKNLRLEILKVEEDKNDRG